MMKTSALVTVPTLYSRILANFPSEHLSFCFAYGSGVFKQANQNKSKNMIDLIFTVDDPVKWHQLNLGMNPSHYSALSYFGSHIISKVQANFSSKMYFNSMIPIKSEGVVIKYGVIAHRDIVTDLLDWDNLYIAGRLHKPVEVILQPTCAELKSALQLNHQSAVHAALLLLPEHFTEAQLYKTITSLSYTGDFRMTFGEDKNKINNIVQAQISHFRLLYEPVFKTMVDYIDIPESETEKLYDDGEKNCSQDISPAAKHYHLNHLPRTPQRNLVRYWNKGSRNRQDTEDVLRAMAYDRDCGDVVQCILSDIVWDSSVKQSLKGIFTAGLLTSVIYSAKKIGKMILSKKTTINKKV